MTTKLTYKWISTEILKVVRGSMRKRLPMMYVLRPGTREATLRAAEDFSQESEALRPAEFVTKANEPGDVGINGVMLVGQTTPLQEFK